MHIFKCRKESLVIRKRARNSGIIFIRFIFWSVLEYEEQGLKLEEGPADNSCLLTIAKWVNIKAKKKKNLIA